MKRWLWLAVLAAAVLAGAAGAALALRDRSAPAEPITVSETFLPPTPSPTPEPAPEPTPRPLPVKYRPAPTPLPVYEDVAAWQEVNPDVVGTLEWGDGEYLPVLQDNDNEYYLHHDINYNYSAKGTLFLDTYCTVEPRDLNWIIYGHNMQSGAMFGRLSAFRQLSFEQAHPHIIFTTLHAKHTYKIIAVLDIDVTPSSWRFFDVMQYNWATKEELDGYFHRIRDEAAYDIWDDVTMRDHTLILSTCSYVYADSRFIVVAKELIPPKVRVPMTWIRMAK